MSFAKKLENSLIGLGFTSVALSLFPLVNSGINFVKSEDEKPQVTQTLEALTSEQAQTNPKVIDNDESCLYLSGVLFSVGMSLLAAAGYLINRREKKELREFYEVHFLTYFSNFS